MSGRNEMRMTDGQSMSYTGYDYPENYNRAQTFAFLNQYLRDYNFSTSYNTPGRSVSFFTRANYAFKDRYLLTLTLRADGSANFAPNNRWGYFPAAAFAWRISDEPWMAGTRDWLSSLKFRLSYGVTGSDSIGANHWRETWSLGGNTSYWKTFKTTWAINQIKSDHTKPFDYQLKDGSKIFVDEYFGKDNTSEVTFSSYLGGMYIINREEYGQKFLTEDIDISWAPKGHKRFRLIDYNTGKYIPDVKALLTYASADASKPENTSMNPNKDGQYPMLAKYLDGDVDKYNLAQGFRDQVIARSAEDYFFKAEALIRQGKINEGIAVLKPLRDRAQFKAGEERDAYKDGGMAFETSSYRSSISAYTNRSVFYDKSSYFYSVGGWDKDQAYRDEVNSKASELAVVSDGNYPPEDEYVMNFLAETNPKYKSDAFTRAMCYLLNEKSREMYGEFLRYNDLVRTRTLEDRLRFNDQAWSENPTDILGHSGNMGTQSHAGLEDGEIAKYSSPNGGHFRKEQHYLRPIPQDFLEKITKDGHPLTQDEINEMQNPGY